MELVALLDLVRQGVLLALVVSVPVVAAGAVTGLFTSLAQSATGVSDPVLSQLPRLALVTAALLALGPWMGRELLGFAARAFGGAP